MGSNPLHASCGPAPIKYIENLGILRGASERLSGLYSKLEDLNTSIQEEQKRRHRVMKRLDKMDSRKGRKDIDYILATPFIDEESSVGQQHPSSKGSSSIPSTIMEEGEGGGESDRSIPGS